MLYLNTSSLLQYNRNITTPEVLCTAPSGREGILVSTAVILLCTASRPKPASKDTNVLIILINNKQHGSSHKVHILRSMHFIPDPVAHLNGEFSHNVCQ